ncbi:hypothetical protein [Ornithinimicrobium faecis]|uniref:hypothetical protein n=1 Tax=Ornithinimicrobium faecis TaxID=2934158 RepID=UPI00211903FF|nr:hypothetical protein [Ornithinimicrobium sp. HY1745]
MSGLALLAGLVSTVFFVSAALPMVVKAVVTRDLESYSLGNLVLANGGNAVHSLYVFSLPAGPIWVLHSFYAVTTAVMLALYLRHADPSHRRASCPPPTPHSQTPPQTRARIASPTP